MLKSRFLVSILCLNLVFIVGGCGKKPNPDGRLDISGKITLNGQDIRNGTIRFTPKLPDGDGGAGGMINNSHFLLTGEYGIKPGEYIVRLRYAIDYDRKTGQPAEPDTPMDNLVVVELIPDKFGKNSAIEFKVEKGQKNVFNYNVEAEPPVLKGKK